MDATRKKIIIYISIFISIILLIFGTTNLVIFLTKPNNHNESKYGIRRILMEGWNGTTDQQYINWANQTLPELNRLGPTFQIVSSGEISVTVVKANIVENINQCDSHAGIAYQPYNRRIIIDTICIRGELEFKTAFMHEIGHSLGMLHICRTEDKNRNDCSPIGRGLAVMNPTLSNETGQDSNIFSGAVIGNLPTWNIQALDIDEFKRIHH
jgi:hypothetical protein